MSEKLLPCPFCGSEAAISLTSTIAKCGDDLCCLGGPEAFWTVEEWNTRHYPQEITELIEAAREWASCNIGESEFEDVNRLSDTVKAIESIGGK